MNLFKSKITETEHALTALQDEHEALNTRFSTLQEELASANQLAATYKGEWDRTAEENTSLKAEVETLKADMAEASRTGLEVDELAARKAAEILAETGHEQVEAIEEPQQIDIAATFKGLKGKELQEFYTTHRKEIAAALKGR